MDGSHTDTIAVLGEQDRSGLKEWVQTVATGVVPAGSCGTLELTMAAWPYYTYNQMVLALGLNVPPRSQITIRASGHCRTRPAKQQVVVKPGGICTLTIETVRGKRILQSLTRSIPTVP